MSIGNWWKGPATSRRFRLLLRDRRDRTFAEWPGVANLPLAPDEEGLSDLALDYLLVLVMLGYVWRCAEREVSGTTSPEPGELSGFNAESIFDRAVIRAEDLSFTDRVMIDEVTRVARGFAPRPDDIPDEACSRAILIGVVLTDAAASNA